MKINEKSIVFDNGLSVAIGDTYEEVKRKLSSFEEYEDEFDLELTVNTNDMIKDYLWKCCFSFYDKKGLSSVSFKFDIHDYIKRNGGYPKDYDYIAWANFCIKVEDDIKDCVDKASENVEIVRKWSQDYRVGIDDLILIVGHGREYESGIYLSIVTREDYEDEYGKIEEPYIE